MSQTRLFVKRKTAEEVIWGLEFRRVVCRAAVTSDLTYTNGAAGTCQISGTVTSTLSALHGRCGGNVTETWTFTDACARTITQTRIITVSPAPIAVFAAAPPITVACGAAVTSDLTYTNESAV